MPRYVTRCSKCRQPVTPADYTCAMAQRCLTCKACVACGVRPGSAHSGVK